MTYFGLIKFRWQSYRLARQQYQSLHEKYVRAVRGGADDDTLERFKNMAYVASRKVGERRIDLFASIFGR